MKRSRSKPNIRRRGVMAVLAAITLVMLLGFIAFAVDIGYIGVVRTQLQTAADAAALAAAGSSGRSQAEMVQTAQEFADANMVAGRHVQLNAGDVEFGSWDAGANTFIPLPSGQLGTAVKVTVRTSADSGGETALFFGRLFGLSSLAQQASAVATVNPRDIAFVVDLSGSMSYDTNPSISSANSTLIQQVYDDFGFGTYPGNSQYAGQPLEISNTSNWVYHLTENKGPLREPSIDSRYRVTGNNDPDKTWKAYAWVMEVQIADSGLMPAAVPVPNADVNYSYWKSFIDSYRSKLGYKSYVTFMMDNGRERRPDGSTYTPLSLESPDCPKHTESVEGQSFQFPPREMPTHSCRRALIAAMQVIQSRNANISNVDQRDQVSIITFDKINNTSPKIEQSLTSDFYSAMTACTRLQACSNYGASTGTEAGLNLAKSHIKPQSQGGLGRERTNKIVVLLTDGRPNLYESSSTAINTYKAEYPSDNFYSSGSYPQNAALMQTSIVQGENWNLYAAGVGGGCDYDFMDRMARMGATANTDGESPRGTADPAAYEAVLKDIFEKIITNPKLRLVQ
ncbi:MAG: VWA domain-containing protein [Planctomycetes bacterium]|nr:VWA domain-containing protein [Planctomycetota bacterium]MCG2684692.1 VWA domain-containing protein [Planctomycetales bacterium]